MVQFICPCCQKDMELGSIFLEENGDILEGLLTCPAGHEFPITDGVAILVDDPSAYVKENMRHFLCRENLNPFIFDILQEPIPEQKSEIFSANAYLWAHYDDLSEHDKKFFSPEIFSPRNTYARFAAHIPNKKTLGIDIGCSVGRLTFELANQVEYVFGVDYQFNSVKKSREIMKNKSIVYRKRKEGTIYHKETRIDLEAVVKQNVEFIAANTLNLPFPDSKFGVATCFNVIDVVGSPEKLLADIARVLDKEGNLILADPYHWVFSFKNRKNWVGGKHVGKYSGLSKEAVKKALEDAGFVIDGEEDEIPWLLRGHDRSYEFYRVHLIEAHKDTH